MGNAQRTSFCHEGAKIGFSSCILTDRARNWWEEVGRALGSAVVVSKSWQEFVTRFQEEFALMIEVKQLESEF